MNCLQRSVFCGVEFDTPQIGNMPLQKIRGPVGVTKVKKTSLQLIKPPEVEVTAVHPPHPPPHTGVVGYVPKRQNNQHPVYSPKHIPSSGATAATPSVSSVYETLCLDLVGRLDQMSLEDTSISMELRVRICDVCLKFKQEGI